MTDTTDSIDAEWRRYGQALLHAMAEVRAETPEELHPLLLETADYWLSLGLAVGVQDPEAAARLLRVIEAVGAEREELAVDARHFVAEVLE